MISRQLMAYEVAERWRWVRELSLRYLPAIIPGERLSGILYGTHLGIPRLRWWWFALRRPDRNAWVTWRHPEWWRIRAERARWKPLEIGLWLGIRETDEGGWYKDATWCWPWRARAPGWRVPTTTIYTWPIYGSRDTDR